MASPTGLIIFALMTFVTPHYDKPKKNSFIRYLQRDHFFIKTPWWLKKLYPGYVWDIKSKGKALYLSFDDGPHPTITPFVLKCLKDYNAKATFFCIGQNVQKYPDVYRQIIEAGHSTGNHTHRHLNGWKTSDEEYLQDIRNASACISSNLFRPPYGRIKKPQAQLLKHQYPEMKIIMWNILTGDWAEDLKPEKCFENIKEKIEAGDIIVFHDTDKAFARLEFALPRVLEHFTKLGFKFERIVV
jgi:peptidoglycan-N-acetylglucosamine deacetylase